MSTSLSSSASDPRVLPAALALMDQAERLARESFEAQSLPHLAAQVGPAREQMVTTSGSESKGLATAEMKDHASDLKRSRSKNVFWDVCGGTIGLVITLGFVLFAFHEFRSAAPQSARSAPFSAVENIRDIAGSLSTQDVQALKAGHTYTFRDGSELTIADWRAIERAGHVTVVDQMGRPELHWSNVSASVCKAFVQDVYGDPSAHGVAATVDGRATDVSCAGPSHEIVLTPHL